MDKCLMGGRKDVQFGYCTLAKIWPSCFPAFQRLLLRGAQIPSPQVIQPSKGSSEEPSQGPQPCQNCPAPAMSKLPGSPSFHESGQKAQSCRLKGQAQPLSLWKPNLAQKAAAIYCPRVTPSSPAQKPKARKLAPSSIVPKEGPAIKPLLP
jgi:hypothetical protein